MKHILYFFFSALLFSLNVSAQSSLVAYYPFNGNAFNVIGPSSGNVVGPVLTTDRFGNANCAYSFDGVDDQIAMANNGIFNLTTYTISLWFKYGGAGTAGKAHWTMISKNATGNGFSDYFMLGVVAGDKTVMGRSGDGISADYNVNNPPAIDDNRWHQATLVFDNASDLLKLFIDGALISSTAATTDPPINISTIRVGFWEGYNNYFKGSIDEIKIYSTALTNAEVLQEYTSSSTGYSGLLGNSITVNGTTDCISVPHNTAFNFTSAITLEAWVYPTSYPTTYVGIIAKNVSTSSFEFDMKNDGTIEWECSIGGVQTFLNGGNVPLNKWTHIAGTYDGSFMRIFQDGVEVKSLATTGLIGINANDVTVGVYSSIASSTKFAGKMDEARIWSVARTEAQIRNAMCNPLAGTETGLVAYYDMNRTGAGNGLTVDNDAQATGSVLNGATVGSGSVSPVFSAAVAQAKPGSGNAANFDGVDDEVNMSGYVVPTTGDFTVDFWVFNRSNTGFREFISQGSSGDAFYVGLDASNTGNMRAGDKWLNTGVTLPLNKWTHVCFVLSGSNATLYLNGISMASVGGYNISAAGTATRLGRQYGSNSEYIDAMLDEVRIWNTALTQTQIRDRMCHKITSSDALYGSLVAYYNLDEGDGTTAFDATSNGNTGTFISGVTRSTSGASIGNSSAHDYVNATKSASISHTSGENFTATEQTGSPAGIHVFVVNEQPNTLSGSNGVGNNNKYFSVFQVNGTSPTYQAVYNYNGNPGVHPSNENTLVLYKRTDNSVTTWADGIATLNTTLKTLTLSGNSTEYLLGSSGVPLPLNNHDFSAYRENKDALLSWQDDATVATTIIERSRDGKTFEQIAQVSSLTQKQYFNDAAIFNKMQQAYYRLAFRSEDGKLDYSVAIRLTADRVNGISIYPNPAQQELHISGLNAGETITLYTIDGKLAGKWTAAAPMLQIDLRHLSKGIYFIRFENGMQEKVVVG